MFITIVVHMQHWFIVTIVIIENNGTMKKKNLPTICYLCTYALVESLKPNMGGGATMLVMITYTHTYCSHHLYGLMRFLDCTTT
jgi:hypothetical protein